MEKIITYLIFLILSSLPQKFFQHLLSLENKVTSFFLKMTQIFGDDAPGILGEEKKLEQ